MSATGEARRHSAKLGQMVNFPFAASLVLNDDHAEVLLYIFLGSNSTMPQTAINIALRYPYQPLLADSKRPQFKIEAPASEPLHQRFLDNFDLVADTTTLAFCHLPVSTPAPEHVVETCRVPSTKPQFLTLATPADNQDDATAAAALLEEAYESDTPLETVSQCQAVGTTSVVHDNNNNKQ